MSRVTPPGADHARSDLPSFHKIIKAIKVDHEALDVASTPDSIPDDLISWMDIQTRLDDQDIPAGVRGVLKAMTMEQFKALTRGEEYIDAGHLPARQGKHAGTEPSAASTADEAGAATPLEMDEGFLDGKYSAWNIEGKVSFKDNATVDHGVLDVVYPAGSSNPGETDVDGGLLFDAKPEGLPAEEVTLSYQFKPSEDFDWTSGGKLGGGLKIGEGAASGHHFSGSAASARVVWNNDGKIQAYVYPMKGTAQKDAYYDQSDSGKGESGDHFFDGLQARENDWNTVVLHVKLNSFKNGKPRADGVLEMSLNGETRTFDQMVWRKSESTQISSLMFTTFVGGKWVMPETGHMQFRHFSLSA